MLKIEHRVGVLATPDVIWDVLSDLPRWAQWNPLYPRAVGQVRIGEVLDLDLQVPGETPQTIRP
jgi:hypothetical protein